MLPSGRKRAGNRRSGTLAMMSTLAGLAKAGLLRFWFQECGCDENETDDDADDADDADHDNDDVEDDDADVLLLASTSVSPRQAGRGAKRDCDGTVKHETKLPRPPRSSRGLSQAPRTSQKKS
eukprot:915777-Pyramimonas_sp.AAC.1